MIVSAPLAVDLVHALVRQAERDELADAVVAEVPADRAGALGQQLDDAQIGQRVDLQAAERARDHHAVEAGFAQLLDQGRRQALLALDLLMIVAQHRLQRGRRLHHGLRVDIDRQAGIFGHHVHQLTSHTAQTVDSAAAPDAQRSASPLHKLNRARGCDEMPASRIP